MLIRFRKIFFLMMSICFLMSCSGALLPDEFISQTSKDPAFNKRYENESFRLSCSYRSPAFLGVMELHRRDSTHISETMFNQAAKQFADGLYFDFSVGLKNGQNITTYNLANQNEYTRLLNELTYNMGKDLYLILENKDTLRSITYNYSNAYGMGKDARFLFVFPRSSFSKGVQTIDVVYSDRVFGIKDAVRFTFTTRDLFDQPNIKFLAS